MTDIRTIAKGIEGAARAIQDLADAPPPRPLPMIHVSKNAKMGQLLAAYSAWQTGRDYTSDAAGEEPEPVPEPPPAPSPPNPGKIPPGPLLFHESRAPQMYEIPKAINMSLSRHKGIGPFPIGCWHPWYDEAGARKMAVASNADCVAHLSRDVDLAVRNGYKGWGVDWEGVLLQPRFDDILASVGAYASANGLLVVHVPRSDMGHQVGEIFPSQPAMCDWCNRHTDGIALWGWGLATSPWNGYRGQLWGLLWPRGDGGRGDAQAKVAWARAHGPSHRVWCGLNNPGQLSSGVHRQPEVIAAVREAWG